MTRQALGLLLSSVTCSLIVPSACYAQEQPLPVPVATATPSAASAGPIWHNPPNTNLTIIDPCGGPKELLNKFGPTPCVYVAGEAMVSFGYANINTHGSLQVTGNGPLGLSASAPISGNANVYPQLLIVTGLTANSQLQISAPSHVDVNTQRFGSFSDSSDPSFNYKQRVFFSPTKYTQLAVDLGYTAPTSAGGINSPGPAYQIQLDLAQPFSQNLSFGLWGTFKNASTSLTQSSERGWSDSIGLYLAWSPAASTFEFLPVVYHNFNPNKTLVFAQAVQLLGRHLSIAVGYGGLENSLQSNGPLFQAFNFATNTTPRILTVNFYYLINESNLPPTPPQQPSPAPSATP